MDEYHSHLLNKAIQAVTPTPTFALCDCEQCRKRQEAKAWALANAEALDKPPLVKLKKRDSGAPPVKKKKGRGNRGVKSSRQKRIKLLAENPLCVYCGVRLTVDSSTLDHVIPKSKGGSGKLKNLVLACRGCNSKKGNNLNFSPEHSGIKELIDFVLWKL